MPKPKLLLQTTSLWDYPSQHYSHKMETLKDYKGATPAYIIWNLLMRYTKPGDLVVDPMCGSGTTLDVAKDTKRHGLGFDLWQIRQEIKRADARKLPLENNKADFVFVDPPYSDHVRYSGLPECIGELSANRGSYYNAMRQVINEIYRILKTDHYMALYVSDSYKKDKPFMPIGFNLFEMLSKKFIPVDIISVTRHNSNLEKTNWKTEAARQNFFLRGFHYLFIMYKGKNLPFRDHRSPSEVNKLVEELSFKKIEEKPAYRGNNGKYRTGKKPD